MLAVVPVRDGVLPAGGAETIAECDGRVVLIGSGTIAAAGSITGTVADVSCMEAASFAPGAWAQALADHVAPERHIVLPGSPDGRDLAPRLAAVLQRALLAGAISVRPHRVELARHGGLVIHDVNPPDAFVATLQPGVRGVEPGEASRREAVAMTMLDFATGRSPNVADARVVEVLAPDIATMDLAESPRILGGGAGLSSPQSFVQLAAIAAHLHASVGATRVITDRGWVGHERQIGTTGVIVAPALYVAFGVSGAVQHTSGLGQPDHIISINTDPHCPMMQLADLAIVSDANAVLVELLERLDEHV